jgi:hypothetical protein
MAEISREVVVTEEMLTYAARAGDLESLTSWARQGVRVTTAEPLYVANTEGQLEVVRCLVQQMGADVNQVDLYGDTPLIVAAVSGILDLVLLLVMELGADINQRDPHGVTPVIAAAEIGNLAVLRCLVQLGADIGAVNDDGYSALLISALVGHYSTAQYLLESAGANMEDVNPVGTNAWDFLIVHLEDLRLVADDDGDEIEADHAALIGLLRVLVLRGAPPPDLVALLSCEPSRVVQEGARLRARLPAYLAHRRAYLDSRCPRISVLPGVLRALIYGFEGSATTEELWATGLGTAP